MALLWRMNFQCKNCKSSLPLLTGRTNLLKIIYKFYRKIHHLPPTQTLNVLSVTHTYFNIAGLNSQCGAHRVLKGFLGMVKNVMFKLVAEDLEFVFWAWRAEVWAEQLFPDCRESIRQGGGWLEELGRADGWTQFIIVQPGVSQTQHLEGVFEAHAKNRSSLRHLYWVLNYCWWIKIIHLLRKFF